MVVIAVAVTVSMQNEENSNTGWATWSSWGTCSVEASCGTGTQERLRLCTKSANNGKDSQCPGSDRQTQNCTIHCPIDGAWTEWSSATACSVTCGKGTTQRTRSCTNPAPRYGGKTCSGYDTNTEACTQFQAGCSASVCFDSYTTFNESYRREGVDSFIECFFGGGECDKDKVIEGEWYRFNLPTGENAVLDHCPGSLFKCGACSQIWMNSSHPTEYGAIKDVTMHVKSTSTNCSSQSVSASVTKCGVNEEVFFLYKLWKPLSCSVSYCAGWFHIEI